MDADLRIGDSRIMVNDAFMGGKGPKALGGSPVTPAEKQERQDAFMKQFASQSGA